MNCDAQFDDSTARCGHCQRRLQVSRQISVHSANPDAVRLTQRQPIFARPLLEALAAAGIPFETAAEGRAHEVDIDSGSSGHMARVEIYVPSEHLGHARTVEAQLLAETLPDLPDGYDPTAMPEGACPACGHALGPQEAECAECGLVIPNAEA